MRALSFLFILILLSAGLRAEERGGEIYAITGNTVQSYPNIIDLLFLKGELLENRKEYIEAYRIYDHILTICPENRAAKDLKYRALMSMGAASLAMQELDRRGDQIDVEIYHGLMGDEAMYRIRWDEPAAALDLLDRNANYINSAGESALQGAFMNEFSARTWNDTIAALYQGKDVDTVIYEYEYALSGTKKASAPRNIPPWVLMDVADSYMCKREPEQALSIYEAIAVAESDPMYAENRISYSTALMETGRFEKSLSVLEDLNRKMPACVMVNGVWRDNWMKEEAALNIGWLLVYQDKLGEAQRYFESMLSSAPFNTHIRSSLAQVYLWRGWPRLALEEFEIIKSINPEVSGDDIGYCYALDENVSTEKARYISANLVKSYPKDKNVLELKRHLALRDMANLAVGSSMSDEYPGTRSTGYFMEVRKSLSPGRRVFSEFIFTSDEPQAQATQWQRGSAGIGWNISRVWQAKASASCDIDGSDPGYASELGFTPYDRVSLTCAYATFSADVFYQARLQGIRSDEKSFSLQYRHSESFEAGGAACDMLYSDGNSRRKYNARVDKSVFTSAFWKTRTSLEWYSETNSYAGGEYFNPESADSAYIVPSVEHTWYRRYNTIIASRFSAGIGEAWQKGFPERSVWYGRLEQDNAISDVTSAIAGVSYGIRYYDDERNDAWSFTLTVNQKF